MTQLTDDHTHSFYLDLPPGLHQCTCGQYAMTVLVPTGDGDVEEGLQLIDDPSDVAAHPFYRRD